MLSPHGTQAKYEGPNKKARDGRPQYVCMSLRNTVSSPHFRLSSSMVLGGSVRSCPVLCSSVKFQTAAPAIQNGVSKISTVLCHSDLETSNRLVGFHQTACNVTLICCRRSHTACKVALICWTIQLQFCLFPATQQRLLPKTVSPK